jgi:site-specific DNA-methyltransferase (adenine-specific)
MNETQLQKKEYRLECGNSKELLKTLESNSIDSIVTDPPYELGFMGKKWDNTGIAYDVELWAECLRVLKHGGHLLAFSGSRTYHRMAVAIEDAGFDIRDQIQWVYGSGFPKSHNISKAIDKMAGAEREVVGTHNAHRDGSIRKQTIYAGIANEGKAGLAGKKGGGLTDITAPATDAAKKWDGWGTALKPAHEPICVARKPLIGTVVENVLAYGTGGINIDGCRVGNEGGCAGAGAGAGARVFANGLNGTFAKPVDGLGRWPANIIYDGSAEVLAGFPSDEKQSSARFFYCAKASKKDRDEGCEGFEERDGGHYAQDDWSRQNMGNTPDAMRAKVRNHHPTVKPTNLMQYLCRLVTPPNGTILDPFLGSGSTGKAAIYEGFNFVGFDLNNEYIDIAKARIEFALNNKEQTLFNHE